ncbi:hypothetical protein PI125_g26648 [Phytophthora idaei]|nr:hypothetical protein PI125_g26648 [Phytophthora idaei]
MQARSVSDFLRPQRSTHIHAMLSSGPTSFPAQYRSEKSVEETMGMWSHALRRLGVAWVRTTTPVHQLTMAFSPRRLCAQISACVTTRPISRSPSRSVFDARLSDEPNSVELTRLDTVKNN